MTGAARARSAIAIGILFVVIFSGLAGATGAVLSPDKLIASGKEYNGNVVSVRGFVVIGFEQRALFTTEADSRSANSHGHCITLANAGILLRHAGRYNKKYVTLKGEFISDLADKRMIVLGACSSSAIDLGAGFAPSLVE